jgi:hypothetical protein
MKNLIEPPEGLLQKIMNRINKEERIASLRKRIFVLFGGMLGSLGIFGYVFKAAKAAATESGFSDYFSLIFSNPSIILNYWQNLLGTLLESFPVMETAILLLLAFIILQILKYTTKDMKIISSLQLTNN